MAFHFDYRSPYSYLAMTQIGDLDLTLHPFDVIDVMKRVGNTPTTITCKVKGHYANADLGRWAGRYGVPLSPNPKMREIEGRRLLRATLAVPDGPERRKAVEALFKAMWGEPAPLGSPTEIAALLSSAGVAGSENLAEQMDGEELEALLDAATAAAAGKGVFGSPSFFIGDAMFFGNDRLEFLREAIEVAA
ncbi:2-hydroxychromene-2-carboxylate isomerase [Novosphingobium sp.]|uniref:2-hydroxychromene-2-carboxylate isomerase n=1 Tax=Novosphingobium sp. TaxID=1874826 RepID=UPI0026241EC0|nr:2-hydroxychromene-2-carboxylate isomerase [Novosphingobium sp.]